jgi:hypothetical protein
MWRTELGVWRPEIWRIANAGASAIAPASPAQLSPLAWVGALSQRSVCLHVSVFGQCLVSGQLSYDSSVSGGGLFFGATRSPRGGGV